MITIHEASLLLGGSEQWVRSLVKRGFFGDAYTTGKRRFTYHIIPGQLAEFMRIPEAELNRRLKRIRSSADDDLYKVFCIETERSAE